MCSCLPEEKITPEMGTSKKRWNWRGKSTADAESVVDQVDNPPLPTVPLF